VPAHAKQFIEVQLKAFRYHERADPDASAYLWRMAEPLSDRVIRGLARYYAGQASEVMHQEAMKLTDEQIQERSAYLADCEPCHTRTGGMPFAGGRPISTPFGFLPKQAKP
jgi:cytochrome c553